jgi:CRP-like cAMP-binding protein
MTMGQSAIWGAEMVAVNWVISILVPVLLGLAVLAAAWAGVRWVGSENLDLARSVPLFAGLSDRQLRSVLRSARTVEFGPRDVIMTEGSPGDSFFLIRRGTVKVSSGGTEVATVGPGSYFGELALIDHGPRTATLTAETQTVSLEVPASGFSRAIDTDPQTSRAVCLKLRDWLAAAGEPVAEPIRDPVDREELVRLTRRVREVQPVDWAEGRPASRRWPWARR